MRPLAPEVEGWGRSVYKRGVIGRALALVLVLSIVAPSADGAEQPPLPPAAQAALGGAVEAAISRFNTSEDRLRQSPRVETTGPANEPYLLRATYRHAESQHQLLGIEAGATPVATVRVRATEFEKRATNVNNTDVAAEFAKAQWRPTPRGYMLDFRLRWTGLKWEQVGEPKAFPVLGTVGRDGVGRAIGHTSP